MKIILAVLVVFTMASLSSAQQSQSPADVIFINGDINDFSLRNFDALPGFFASFRFDGYLDVQNVTNRANPEAIFPNYNCNGYATLTGIPIFPTIGLRVEF